MIAEVAITLYPEHENDKSFISNQILKELKKNGITVPKNEPLTYHVIKKSIDARHGRQKFFVRYKVCAGKSHDEETFALPEWKTADGDKSVLIIGSGPAGLFAALKLLEHGIQPVIIERGRETGARKRSIAAISTRGEVDPDSNYCFGEGGAGTFSDGKLYTRSNKRGDIRRILSIFRHFGADDRILTDAHPHIGTDRLPAIINSMRERILSSGGKIFFSTRCTDFIMDSGTIRGIRCVHTDTGMEREFFSDAVILASGHSAGDIYALLSRIAPSSLEAKTFAMGVRVEHPREIIDRVQYHGGAGGADLGAAEYRFTSQQEGRGVYSFCMCPGGFVVPSATSPGQTVVNGMSAARRNGRWSNAAFVVETRPCDVPDEFKEKAERAGTPQLAGLEYRTWLEEESFRQAQNARCGKEYQSAPAQRLEDFLRERESLSLPETSYAPGIVPSALHEWMPHHISSRLRAGLSEAGRKMPGFICKEAVLIASETRTSTPVRILRHKETMESTAIKRLYPAGEGSGYSGGIVSSAMDGEACAEKIAQALGAKTLA